MKNIVFKLSIALLILIQIPAFSQREEPVAVLSQKAILENTSSENALKTNNYNLKMKNIGILLFNNFETLDVFGPVEIFGRLKDLYHIEFYSLEGGIVTSSQNVKILTQKLSEKDQFDIFLIPGGMGTRKEVGHEQMISTISGISASSAHVLTVCTGSALLAKTGQINGLSATSNKRSFDWVVSQGAKVNWIKKARWTVDGKYYTSSGVSAGMDMTLGFIRDIHGIDLARKIAYEIEYTWQENKEVDEFYLQDLKQN